MNILVTGANGFIGRAVCQTLSAAGHTVFALAPCAISLKNALAPRRFSARRASPTFMRRQTLWILRTRSCRAFASPRWRLLYILRRASMKRLKNTPRFRAACHETNVAGTLRVAAAAARAGARRFIFVSSIKALGEIEPGRPWREDDSPAPSDPYGHSKYAAEVALRAACQ